jgi:hypothetical protein
MTEHQLEVQRYIELKREFEQFDNMLGETRGEILSVENDRVRKYLRDVMGFDYDTADNLGYEVVGCYIAKIDEVLTKVSSEYKSMITTIIEETFTTKELRAYSDFVTSIDGASYEKKKEIVVKRMEPLGTFLTGSIADIDYEQILDDVMDDYE